MPVEAKHAALADLLRLRRDSSASKTRFLKESLQAFFQSRPCCVASCSSRSSGVHVASPSLPVLESI